MSPNNNSPLIDADGPVRIGVAARKDGLVQLTFGRPVDTLVLKPQEAAGIAQLLIQQIVAAMAPDKKPEEKPRIWLPN